MTNIENHIVELSASDLEFVAGGPLPLIAIAYVGIAISGTVLAVGSAFVAGVEAGYFVNKDTD